MRFFGAFRALKTQCFKALTKIPQGTGNRSLKFKNLREPVAEAAVVLERSSLGFRPWGLGLLCQLLQRGLRNIPQTFTWLGFRGTYKGSFKGPFKGIYGDSIRV